jgi:CRP-like cAMP-binding protein
VPDLLDRIREEISMRLAELRPLVDEHHRLAAAVRALGDAHGEAPGSASAGTPVPIKPHKTAPKQARKRAPRGANREAVLRAAQERPGATGAELAAVSGVDRNTLNALLARLVDSGELQTLEQPTGRTGYALAKPATPFAPADLT